jgi:L-fucose mutarotase
VRRLRLLKSTLLHPEILHALAGAGHGSQALIADGNYPCSTTAGPNAEIVYLNLAPGLVSATDVLRALVEAIPIEAAHVM